VALPYSTTVSVGIITIPDGACTDMYGHTKDDDGLSTILLRVMTTRMTYENCHIERSGPVALKLQSHCHDFWSRLATIPWIVMIRGHLSSIPSCTVMNLDHP